MKNYQIFLLLILAAGIILGLNYHSSSVSKTKVNPSTETLKRVDLSYQNQLKNYRHKADSLENKLHFTINELERQERLKQFAEQRLEKLLKTPIQRFSGQEKSVRCDSLHEASLAFKQQVEQSDSLKNQRISTLETISSEKEGQLLNCNEAYNDLKQVVEDALQDAEQLKADNQKLMWQNSWQRFKNGLLTVLAFTLTTVAGILAFK